MRRKYIILLISLLVLVLIVLLVVWNRNIQCSISSTKQQYRIEATEYLKEKYLETMIVTEEVIISDEKSVKAYPVKFPEIEFYVRKGDGIYDTYLYASLRHEAERILKDAFIGYESEIYVSELKWCNPTPDGKFETFYYLDELYKSLERIPVWKDINEYQKIEIAKVDINDISSESDIFEIIEGVKKMGCNIENLQITDGSGKIYEYSIE